MGKAYMGATNPLDLMDELAVLHGPTAAIALREQYPLETRLIRESMHLYDALRAVTSSLRTFRNVPQDDQAWVSSDDEALDFAFEVLDRIERKE